MLEIIFVYLYLIYGLYKVCKNELLNPLYLVLLFAAMLKASFDYRVCTVAYAECKIRGISRELSIVNRLLDPIIDIRYTDHIYPIFIFSMIILSYNIYWYIKIFKV